jgi:type III pantothenate kinase
MTPKPDEMRAWRLYADLGNSTLHWAAYQGQRWRAQGRVPTDRLDERDTVERIVSELEAAGLEREACGGSALVTSRPGLAEVGERILAEVCGRSPLLLGRDIRSELPVEYYDAAQIGQDRLAAAEGALARFPPPLVLLGFGTCVTAEAISAEGVLVGGAIAPGRGAQLAGLWTMVPHLREAIEEAALAARGEGTPPPVGRSTAESLWLGLLGALAGTAERLVRLMREQVGEQAQALATGGDAALVAAHAAVIDRVEPMLVLEGLRAIDERHSAEE